MGRENKKEAIAALHREQILRAAEKLFYEKGYSQTTVEDISQVSRYSRRTVYAYYESKEDILHHIVEKGLERLRNDVGEAVNRPGSFTDRYEAVCEAMARYQREYPHAAGCVNRSSPDRSSVSATVKHILALGEEINRILAAFLRSGQESGAVRKDVVPMMSVYVLWAGITALLEMTASKGAYICEALSVSEEEFLEYGFRQLLNSVLEERI